MSWIIDRIEEGVAVLENMETQEVLELPRGELPKGCREGSMLKYENDCFIRDLAGDAARLELIKDKMSRLKIKPR